ncbi:anaerobic C4-dicarboxylate transporter family protein [Maridesulfovibrio ferrireducens]|uniref:anaerobic C4-dicarboxylate transporter family protein n=1 Tax=Maridesulfovibrio ferrireducens TaxID=246191 RepID=UPI001A29C9D6|nr:anaerobic C4-dicarboxylate transporter family protein [Maridesulfovibrio ferrireducens]MBI9111657.1 hypothetical protein [Maridesulfovibrio ferrireducens]
MFWVHLLLLLVIIFIGIRYGGVAILVFAFGVKPGNPPVSVMLIILAVVAASTTLEATGGLSLLVKFADKFYDNILNTLYT